MPGQAFLRASHPDPQASYPQPRRSRSHARTWANLNFGRLIHLKQEGGARRIRRRWCPLGSRSRAFYVFLHGQPRPITSRRGSSRPGEAESQSRGPLCDQLPPMHGRAQSAPPMHGRAQSARGCACTSNKPRQAQGSEAISPEARGGQGGSHGRASRAQWLEPRPNCRHAPRAGGFAWRFVIVLGLGARGS